MRYETALGFIIWYCIGTAVYQAKAKHKRTTISKQVDTDPKINSDLHYRWQYAVVVMGSFFIATTLWPVMVIAPVVRKALGKEKK